MHAIGAPEYAVGLYTLWTCLGQTAMTGIHLLLLSLGPVQDFIAAGRRCQDLWFGSHLLSELSRAAAGEIATKCGPEVLIFPGNLNQSDAHVGDERTAVANRILARLPAEHEPRAVAEAAQAAVGRHLHQMADKAWAPFAPFAKRGTFDKAVARQQLDELMEFMWVAVPEQGDYAAARERAEALLAGRKATRNWPEQSSSAQGAGVPKCALDGVRESVVHRVPRRTPEELKRLESVFLLRKPNEQLSGIGLLKRRGVDEATTEPTRPAFHSNSHIAAAPLLTRLACLEWTEDVLPAGYDLQRRTKVRAGATERATLIRPPAFFQVDEAKVPVQVDRVFDQRGWFGHDGTPLFRERIGPDLFGVKEPSDGVEKIQAEIGQMLDKLGITDSPCPYYGLLLADGDHMGDKIRDLADAGWSRHQAFSARLDAFARSARNTVADHGGSLIYAGGDDVLALVPLHTALACAQALRTDFTQIGLDFPGIGDFTFSVGLAVAHHLTPMGRARSLAKRAEHAAKEAAGRNALAIIVDKRSGGTLQASARWAGEHNPLIERIERWAWLIHAAELPSGLAHELLRMHQVLDPRRTPGAGQGGNAAPDATEAVRAVAHQILARKRAAHGDEAMAGNTNQMLEDALDEHFKREQQAESNKPVDALRTLAEELQIAQQFLHAYRDAWGPLLARSQPEGDAQ